MEKISKSGSCSSSSPIRRRLKHQVTRMLLLHSTCTMTAAAVAAAGDLVKLSKCTLPKQKLVGYSQQEPFLPRARRLEKKTRKKERRLTEVGDLYVTGERERRKCPPASPSSPMRNCCRHCSRQAGNRKKKKSYRIGKETRKLPANIAYRFSISSSSDCNDELGLYSSTDEDEESESGTLFSSRTLSSDSSGFYCSNRKKKTTTTKKKKKKKRKSGKLAFFSAASLKEKVEADRSAGFAVVKNSSDPYMDFLNSMAEMILELQVSTLSDVEKLLDSYLDLNSAFLHPLILKAFVDVWEAPSLCDRFDSISLCL